jgi:hypothetical protein
LKSTSIEEIVKSNEDEKVKTPNVETSENQQFQETGKEEVSSPVTKALPKTRNRFVIPSIPENMKITKPRKQSRPESTYVPKYLKKGNRKEAGEENKRKDLKTNAIVTELLKSVDESSEVQNYSTYKKKYEEIVRNVLFPS